MGLWPLTAGTYKYANGDVYEGEWKDDSKVGKGDAAAS
jgi:hypothetical protein